jgi:CubicO group peptidase (beta-lactamase class C family)
MQRALVVIAMVGLVIAALAAGALAAHWPFWQRAWQWHSLQQGRQVASALMPARIPGPSATLQPATSPLPLTIVADPRLAAVVNPGTSLLLVAGHDGHTRAYFAARDQPVDELVQVDGRALVNGLQVLLVGALIQQGRANLLDEPVGENITQWHEDPRGVITPRQLLWQLSGLSGGPFRPLDPFSPLAQLASGPDFQRAVLRTPLRYPPGSHFEASMANPQLLALVVSRLSGESHAVGLERFVWSRIAARSATVMLDRPRGEMAAHCCFSASAGDWLRAGLLLANRGRSQDLQILPPDFVEEVATASPVNPGQGLAFRVIAGAGGRLLQLAADGRLLLVAPDAGAALFWVGTGEPPPGLAALLLQGQGIRVQ